MDKIKKIKELQELLDSGMINKSEFDKLKSEIIDGKEIAQSSASIERENSVKTVNQKSRAERIKNRQRTNASRPNIPPKKKKKKSKKWMLWLFIPLFLFLVLGVVTLVVLENQSSINQWEYYEEYEEYSEPEAIYQSNCDWCGEPIEEKTYKAAVRINHELSTVNCCSIKCKSEIQIKYPYKKDMKNF